MNGSLTKISLEILVEYAYTAQLEVPDALVRDVYLAAWQLKIDKVVSECARHLTDEMSADTCIEIRSLPGISRNKQFVTAVDDFISREVNKIVNHRSELSFGILYYVFISLILTSIYTLHESKTSLFKFAVEKLARWAKINWFYLDKNSNPVIICNHVLLRSFIERMGSVEVIVTIFFFFHSIRRIITGFTLNVISCNKMKQCPPQNALICLLFLID